jgi:hypothetical protein
MTASPPGKDSSQTGVGGLSRKFLTGRCPGAAGQALSRDANCLRNLATFGVMMATQ